MYNRTEMIDADRRSNTVMKKLPTINPHKTYAEDEKVLKKRTVVSNANANLYGSMVNDVSRNFN